jgi:ubiquinone/menaquinone biosynthesis C-methylase UbiE
MGRLDYQQQWAVGSILNIGCADDPAKFGARAVHFDIDWWDQPNFVHGDCHCLPFTNKQFDTAIMGDTLEHCERPEVAVKEAARVAKRLVLTIPEETHLPSVGQHPVEVALKMRADTYRKEDGFPVEMSDEDVVVAHKRMHDKRFIKAWPETLMPHDYHINRFDEAAIQNLIKITGMPVLDYRKVPEVDWMNWLITLG